MNYTMQSVPYSEIPIGAVFVYDLSPHAPNDIYQKLADGSYKMIATINPNGKHNVGMRIRSARIDSRFFVIPESVLE